MRARSAGTAPREVYLSAKTGEGLGLLRQALLAAAGWQRSGETLFLARARHLRALESAQYNLAAARDALPRWELFAEELRLAQEALNQITGEFSSDDLLGEIFSRFYRKPSNRNTPLPVLCLHLARHLARRRARTMKC